MSSDLEKLAARVRQLSAQAGNQMAALQDGARAAWMGMNLASSSRFGARTAQHLLAACTHFETAMAGVAEFAIGANHFGDALAANRAPTSPLSAVKMGAHGALAEQHRDGKVSQTRFDPLTGNDLTWTKDTEGRLVSSKVFLRGLSREGRTNKEISASRAVGRSVNTEYHQDPVPRHADGGHDTQVGVGGSNGPFPLFPQDPRSNRSGPWRKYENVEKKLITQGYEVNRATTYIYGDEGVMPSGMIVEMIATAPDGQIKKMTEFFKNILP